MKSFLIFTFGLLTTVSAVQAETFCGRIRGVDYVQSSSGIQSYMYLDSVRGYQSHATLSTLTLKVSDSETVYKVAQVIAELSIQNSAQLKQDLLNKSFEWSFLVGKEGSTNPYEEFFEVCLDAKLDSVSQNRELKTINAIVDIFEDGHSVKDLLK